MFKKVFLIGGALVFAVGILTASVYRTSAQMVVPIEFEVSEKATPEAKRPVEYPLTYPGILPDHFLYPIKMIRDRIWLFLTTDPLKKAELLLKFADKRIWSAQMLVEKGKTKLGVSTATEAEKYLQRAIDQEKIARERGKDTTSFLQRLSWATLKHEEVLLGIKEQVADPVKTEVEKALEYSRRGYEKVRGRLGQ